MKTLANLKLKKNLICSSLLMLLCFLNPSIFQSSVMLIWQIKMMTFHFQLFSLLYNQTHKKCKYPLSWVRLSKPVSVWSSQRFHGHQRCTSRILTNCSEWGISEDQILVLKTVGQSKNLKSTISKITDMQVYLAECQIPKKLLGYTRKGFHCPSDLRNMAYRYPSCHSQRLWCASVWGLSTHEAVLPQFSGSWSTSPQFVSKCFPDCCLTEDIFSKHSAAPTMQASIIMFHLGQVQDS